MAGLISALVVGEASVDCDELSIFMRFFRQREVQLNARVSFKLSTGKTLEKTNNILNIFGRRRKIIPQVLSP